ncbi:MAG: hypothetical protein PHG66_00065 [Candidatus Colwellbacteria bacterium]|nr:hypothetical protein [Candidatus Colwellbacteria bacterium]
MAQVDENLETFNSLLEYEGEKLPLVLRILNSCPYSYRSMMSAFIVKYGECQSIYEVRDDISNLCPECRAIIRAAINDETDA